MPAFPFYRTSVFKMSNKIGFAVLLLAVLVGWLIAVKGVEIAFLLMILPVAVAALMLLFYYPKAGLIFFIVYSFLVPFLNRCLEGVQFGLGQDILLILTWLAVIFHRSNRFRFRHL